MESFIFQTFYGAACEKEKTKLQTNSDQGREKQSSAPARADVIHCTLNLRNSYDDADLKIKYHKNCVSKYCLVKNQPPQPPPWKKRRASIETPFRHKKDCVYCANPFDIVKDPKHPDRWDEAYCVTENVFFCKTRNKNIEYQVYIKEHCQARNDKLGIQVGLRIDGIHIDAVASDVRYHKRCKGSFFLHMPKDGSCEKDTDNAVLNVADEFVDQQMIWNASELHTKYTLHGGTLDRRMFIANLLIHFGGKLISFHSNGYAKLLCFNNHDCGVIISTKDKNQIDGQTDTLDAAMDIVAQQLKEEINAIKTDQSCYQTDIEIELSAQ